MHHAVCSCLPCRVIASQADTGSVQNVRPPRLCFPCLTLPNPSLANVWTWPCGQVYSSPQTQIRRTYIRLQVRAPLAYLTIGTQPFSLACRSLILPLPSSLTPSPPFLPLHSLSCFPHSHTFHLLSLNHLSTIWTKMLAELKISLDDWEISAIIIASSNYNCLPDQCTKSNLSGKETMLLCSI